MLKRLVAVVLLGLFMAACSNTGRYVEPAGTGGMSGTKPSGGVNGPRE